MLDWTVRHGRSAALYVALKTAPDQVLTEDWAKKTVRVIIGLLQVRRWGRRWGLGRDGTGRVVLGQMQMVCGVIRAWWKLCVVRVCHGVCGNSVGLATCSVHSVQPTV